MLTRAQVVTKFRSLPEYAIHIIRFVKITYFLFPRFVKITNFSIPSGIGHVYRTNISRIAYSVKIIGSH